ncbi:MAG: hypothetical protein R3F61_25385 [Myxococcota bacterium]
MRWTPLLALFACTGPGPTEPCGAPAEPVTCELGDFTDSGTWQPLASGQEVPVWFGLQGGMHIEFVLHEANATPIVRVSTSARESGETISIDGSVDVLTFAAEPTCSGEQVGVRAVLDTSDGFERACGLDGSTVELDVTVEREDGDVATCSATVTARFEPFTRDQCESIFTP